MRAYLFNDENGLYAGETFEEPDKLQYEEGITSVPPPEFKHGQIPVFNRLKNEWHVIPLTIARNFIAGNTPESNESSQ